MPESLYSIAFSRMWSSEGQDSPPASIVSLVLVLAPA